MEADRLDSLQSMLNSRSERFSRVAVGIFVS